MSPPRAGSTHKRRCRRGGAALPAPRKASPNHKGFKPRWSMFHPRNQTRRTPSRNPLPKLPLASRCHSLLHRQHEEAPSIAWSHRLPGTAIRRRIARVFHLARLHSLVFSRQRSSCRQRARDLGIPARQLGKTILLLTRTDDSRPETYLVSLGPRKTVFDCGEWHPLRFLPFPVGDVNPPCTIFTVDPTKVHDPPTAATPTTGRNFIEFITVSGKKVRAQW